MKVLAPNFEAQVIEEGTEAPTLRLETSSIMGVAVFVPIEAIDTETESKKGPQKKPELPSIVVLEMR